MSDSGDPMLFLVEGEVSRRAVARAALGAVPAIAGGVLTGRVEVRAQASPPAAEGADDAGPLRYALTGGDTTIDYLPAAGGEPARLAYHAGDTEMEFAGEEITEESSAGLGRLVTVMIEAVPDGYVRDLTLLVPDVNPVDGQPSVPVATLAIVTTHLTSIGGPRLVAGPLQEYEVVAVAGTAEFAPT
jgi:hypothetical protein